MSQDTNISARARTAYGAAGVAILLVLALAAAIAVIPDKEGKVYTAVFTKAGQGMDQHSDVKVRGIQVGAVEDVGLLPDGRVKVRFRVEDGIKIPTSAVARIEPVSVFGPKDLRIDLGDEANGPYLEEGQAIAQTRDPEDLADISEPAYRLTEAIKPDDLAAIVHTFSQGLSGQGPAMRRTVDNSAKLVDLAYANRKEIKQLIADVGGLAETMENRGDSVVGAARGFNRIAPTIYERPDKVNELLAGASKLSDTAATLLDRHGTDINAMIDGGDRMLGVLNAQNKHLPQLIDGVAGFFNMLGLIIRVPGPEGSLLAQANDVLPLDTCKIIVDVCGPAYWEKEFWDETLGKKKQEGR